MVLRNMSEYYLVILGILVGMVRLISSQTVPEPLFVRGCRGNRGQFPHETYCQQYYNCWDGRATIEECPGKLLFNPVTSQCDYPEAVNCLARLRNPAPSVTSDGRCLKQFGTFPDPTDCTAFYTCSHGRSYRQVCPYYTAFDERYLVCVHAYDVECAGRGGIYGTLAPPLFKIPDGGTSSQIGLLPPGSGSSGSSGWERRAHQGAASTGFGSQAPPPIKGYDTSIRRSSASTAEGNSGINPTDSSNWAGRGDRGPWNSGTSGGLGSLGPSSTVTGSLGATQSSTSSRNHGSANRSGTRQRIHTSNGSSGGSSGGSSRSLGVTDQSIHSNGPLTGNQGLSGTGGRAVNGNRSSTSDSRHKSTGISGTAVGNGQIKENNSRIGSRITGSQTEKVSGHSGQGSSNGIGSSGSRVEVGQSVSGTGTRDRNTNGSNRSGNGGRSKNGNRIPGVVHRDRSQIPGGSNRGTGGSSSSGSVSGVGSNRVPSSGNESPGKAAAATKATQGGLTGIIAKEISSTGQEQKYERPISPEATFRCPQPRGLYPNALDCSRFWLCREYKPSLLKCPTGQLFDLASLSCTNPEKAQCSSISPRT